MSEKTIIGGLFFSGAYCLLGIVSALSKYLQTNCGYHTSELTFFSFLVVAACLLPWVLRSGGLKALKTNNLPLILLRSALGFSLFLAFYATSHHLPIVNAVTLFNTAPLWVPLWAILILQERLSKKAALCILGGFAGMLFVMHPRLQGLNLRWDVVGISSGVMMAAVIVIMRKLKDEPWQRIIFCYAVVGTVFSAVAMVPTFKMPQGHHWLVFLAMGALMYLIQWFATVALHYARAIVLAPLTYSSIIVSGLIGWLIWGHIPTLLMLLGIFMIILSGVLILIFELQEIK